MTCSISRGHLSPERGLEIAVGLVMAFLSSLLVIRPFLAFVGAVGVGAVRVVPHRPWHRAARGDRRRVGARMMSWLRRRFVTGFFVLVPLVVSIVALIWVFRVVDGFTAPLYERYFKVYHAARCRRGLALSRRPC